MYSYMCPSSACRSACVFALNLTLSTTNKFWSFRWACAFSLPYGPLLFVSVIHFARGFLNCYTVSYFFTVPPARIVSDHVALLIVCANVLFLSNIQFMLFIRAIRLIQLVCYEPYFHIKSIQIYRSSVRDKIKQTMLIAIYFPIPDVSCPHVTEM